jgi:hypothetical protein
VIQINARFQILIGDSLAAVPFMKHLCDMHSTSAYITDGFCLAVRPLVRDYPFLYTEPSGDIAARYEMPTSEAWHEDLAKGWPWHLSQMFFGYNRLAIPPLPSCFPMHSEPCGLKPGVVLTPFSRSNLPDNNKLWPHERWLRVCSKMHEWGCEDFYVVGSSQDDFSAYAGNGLIRIVKDEPLPRVLDLLRTSKLVLGLDNGISHLAHFGGVHRHVMIYADCLPPRLAENPLGVHVRGPKPADIMVEQVVAAIDESLKRWSHDNL